MPARTSASTATTMAPATTPAAAQRVPSANALRAGGAAGSSRLPSRLPAYPRPTASRITPAEVVANRISDPPKQLSTQPRGTVGCRICQPAYPSRPTRPAAYQPTMVAYAPKAYRVVTAPVWADPVTAR